VITEVFLLPDLQEVTSYSTHVLAEVILLPVAYVMAEVILLPELSEVTSYSTE